MVRSEDVKVYFDRHAAELVLYARQWVHDRADAEDAVQEAFVRLSACAGVTLTDPIAYLYASVRSRALDFRRSRFRRLARERRAMTTHDEPYFDPAAGLGETRAAVEAALKSLPSEQAEVVVMKIWGGLTFAQIAEAVGISHNTAASRYRYAIGALRQTLKQEVER